MAQTFQSGDPVDFHASPEFTGQGGGRQPGVCNWDGPPGLRSHGPTPHSPLWEPRLPEAVDEVVHGDEDER